MCKSVRTKERLDFSPVTQALRLRLSYITHTIRFNTMNFLEIFSLNGFHQENTTKMSNSFHSHFCVCVNRSLLGFPSAQYPSYILRHPYVLFVVFFRFILLNVSFIALWWSSCLQLLRTNKLKSKDKKKMSKSQFAQKCQIVFFFHSKRLLYLV